MFNEYFRSNGENIVNVELINHREAFYYPNFTNKNICKFIKYGQFSIGSVLAMSNPNYYTGSVLKQLEKGDRNFVYHVKLLPRVQR